MLRRVDVFVTAALSDLHEQLKAFYSDIGRPSVDPELIIRMLLAGHCYGIRHEMRLCQEVAADAKAEHHELVDPQMIHRLHQSDCVVRLVANQR